MKKILPIFMTIVISGLLGTRAFAQDYSFLTPEEKKIYDKGDLSDVRAVGGGLAGTFLGLGIGHAVIKSYGDIGWIFTVGELASLGVLIGGLAWAASNTDDNGIANDDLNYNAGSLTLTVTGIVGLVGFRVWELVDVWTRPWDMQDDFRAVERKVRDFNAQKKSSSFFLIPSVASNGSYGATMGFRF